jgi:sigma-B regulation protein RsbU (phosphoserine phosphatase)
MHLELSFIQLSYLSEPGSQDPSVVLQGLRAAILTNSIFFTIVGLSLTQFVIVNFAVPLKEIIQVLKDIRRGSFDRKVIVRSNDEIGYTGDVVNEMATGLKERDRMRHSLFLARDVQQNLLPAANPQIEGLDIAGTSIYCDETGGDYYDFIISDDRLYHRSSLFLNTAGKVNYPYHPSLRAVGSTSRKPG